LALQADPALNSVKQGKILLQLIDKAEQVALDKKARFNGFSIMPEFDISIYLIRKGYKLSDLIYLKSAQIK